MVDYTFNNLVLVICVTNIVVNNKKKKCNLFDYLNIRNAVIVCDLRRFKALFIQAY